MKHQDIKNRLLENQEVQAEYENLAPAYEIKNQIIQIRVDLGISQKELAEMVGTKQSAISRLESGAYNPSVEFLNKVAHALGKQLHISIV